MTTMPGRKSVIRHAGLDEEVADMLFRQALTFGEISKILKEKHGLDISITAISRFKEFVLDSASELAAGDQEYKDKLAKLYLDTTEMCITLKQTIEEKITQFEDSDDWKAQTSYLSLALTLLQTLMKKLGEIKPTQIIENQTINAMQINNMVQVELIRLIDEGKIPLEHCAPEIKEFYRKAKQVANA